MEALATFYRCYVSPKVAEKRCDFILLCKKTGRLFTAGHNDLDGKVIQPTSTNQLTVPLFNLSAVGKRAFPVSGGTFQNSLPSHLTSAPSLAIFRQRLKTFLFHLSYPDLVI